MEPAWKELWEDEPDHASSVDQFYRGKVVLLTGATGFLGKLYMEKLARSDVKELILIVREKKGVSPRDRIEKLWETEAVLKRYRVNVRNCRQKTTIIRGDLEEDNLAIEQRDIEYIREKTDIVLHAAADVRFDETLAKAVITNVKGTWEMLKLCVEIKKLDLFIYISTAYANCINKQVYEQFYDPPTDPFKMLELVQKADEQDLEVLTSVIIRPWPNTYTFAKALAEHLVSLFYHRMNLVVIRPSIVISTIFDPVPGWTDNLYGLNGVIVGAGVGILRVLHTKDDKISDAVPADFVINGTLVAAKKVYERNQIEPPSTEADRVAIFHLTSGIDNPLLNGRVQRLIKSIGVENPPLRSLWIGSYFSTQYEFVGMMLTILLHFFPGVIIDFLLRFNGKKPRLMKIYRKVRKFTGFISFFATQEFCFVNDKMRQVFDTMDAGDRKLFPCDMKIFAWEDFFNVYCPGLKMYMLNEGPETWEAAKMRYDRLHRITEVLCWVGGLVMGYWILTNMVVHACPLLTNLVWRVVPEALSCN